MEQFRTSRLGTAHAGRSLLAAPNFRTVMVLIFLYPEGDLFEKQPTLKDGLRQRNFWGGFLFFLQLTLPFISVQDVPMRPGIGQRAKQTLRLTPLIHVFSLNRQAKLCFLLCLCAPRAEQQNLRRHGENSGDLLRLGVIHDTFKA